MNILHLTDLHIKEVDSDFEHLAKGYYSEYINKLHEKIQLDQKDIDLIAITGDFIEKGKISNFSHAKEVILYIAKKFSCTIENVIVCPGNHDLQRELDTIEKYKESRLPFIKDLCPEYPEDKVIRETDYFKLTNPKKNTLCLTIDSTRNKGVNGPGKIDISEEDLIIREIQAQELNSEFLLLIATHYPIEHFPNSGFYSEDDHFENHHFWRQGERLRNRIIENTPDVNKLWICGDIHLPTQMKYGNNLFVTTGRFGGEVFKPEKLVKLIREAEDLPKLQKEISSEMAQYTSQNRQAKLICLSDQTEVITYRFLMPGHIENPRNGNWETAYDRNILEVKLSDHISRSSPLPKTKPEITHEGYNLISSSISESIIEKVSRERLYKFDKHITSESLVSLGWITIHKLLNNRHLLPRIIDESKDWIKRINIQDSEILLIGIDYWGFIIASNLSIRLGIKNFCFSSRNPRKYDSQNEMIPSEMISSHITKYSPKNVLIITDVIGTGNTLLKRLNDIKDLFVSAQISIPDFYAITVLSDSMNEKFTSLKDFKIIGSFCDGIRIPIIEKKRMPDEKILQTRIDLT